VSGWADGRNGLHGGHSDLTVLDRQIFSETVLLPRLKEHTTIRRVDLPPSSGGKGKEKMLLCWAL
jgi:hypothetical protein